MSFTTLSAAEFGNPKRQKSLCIEQLKERKGRTLQGGYFSRNEMCQCHSFALVLCFFLVWASSPAYEGDSDLPLHGSLRSRTCSAPADSHLSLGMPLTVLPVVRKLSSNNFRSSLFMPQNISGLPFVTPPSLSASQHFLWVLGRHTALITLVRNQGLLKLPLASVFIGEHPNVRLSLSNWSMPVMLGYDGVFVPPYLNKCCVQIVSQTPSVIRVEKVSLLGKSSNLNYVPKVGQCDWSFSSWMSPSCSLACCSA